MSADENPALAVRVPAGPRSAIRRDASKMLGFDRLGALVASIMAVGVFASPFVTYRATRIAAGEPGFCSRRSPRRRRIALLALMIAVAVLGGRWFAVRQLRLSPPVRAGAAAARDRLGGAFRDPGRQHVRAGDARARAFGSWPLHWHDCWRIRSRVCGSDHGSGCCRFQSRRHCSGAFWFQAPGAMCRS